MKQRFLSVCILSLVFFADKNSSKDVGFRDLNQNE
jgi:hypothetical protein